MSLMSAHMDRELGYQELREVELHLEDCEACRAEYEALRATKELVGSLREAELPREFWAELRPRLGARGASTTRGIAAGLSRWVAPALAVVALVVAPLLWNAYRRGDVGTQAQSLADAIEPYFRDYVISEYDRPLSDKTSVGFVATAQAVTMYTADRLPSLEPRTLLTETGGVPDASLRLSGAAGAGGAVGFGSIGGVSVVSVVGGAGGAGSAGDPTATAVGYGVPSEPR